MKKIILALVCLCSLNAFAGNGCDQSAAAFGLQSVISDVLVNSTNGINLTQSQLFVTNVNLKSTDLAANSLDYEVMVVITEKSTPFSPNYMLAKFSVLNTDSICGLVSGSAKVETANE